MRCWNCKHSGRPEVHYGTYLWICTYCGIEFYSKITRYVMYKSGALYRVKYETNISDGIRGLIEENDNEV